MELPEALRDRRPNLSAARYNTEGGDFLKWAGGSGFTAAQAAREVAVTGGRARPADNPVALHDRQGPLPYD